MTQEKYPCGGTSRSRGTVPLRQARGEPNPRSGSDSRRFRCGSIAIFGAMSLVLVQLLWVQVINSSQLSAEAAKQRAVKIEESALRGPITDRNGNILAFTVEARALTFRPVAIRRDLEQVHNKNQAANPQERMKTIAKGISSILGSLVNENTLLNQFNSEEPFVYLAKAVDIERANAINKDFPEVGTERQDIREYPAGALGANIIGATNWEGHGLLGLEDALDSDLSGTKGSQIVDRASDGTIIPGSRRDNQPAINGSGVQLTIDTDLQYFVQQQIQQAKDLSGAKNASAVVLDAKTGEIRAMANDNTFNPTQDLAKQRSRQLGNPAVTSPFEPGSVNKIVTAAAAIENGLTTPDEVFSVPGSLRMGGVVVKDAWPHGTDQYTTTGIFGKSSNVGTLMLAQRVGEERYSQMLDKFGLGQRTEAGLSGESSGNVPRPEQWSGSTFANLPIGQGLSMTLLQMTSMYQAIANEGVRIPPRIVQSITTPDGVRTPSTRPEGVRVVNPNTAATVSNMFRAVVQNDRGHQQGTGPSAAIEGYQISGKTGTAQKYDPKAKRYSDSDYWITFAGIVPADNPRYVIGLMLDNPPNRNGGQGQSAAPLFHDIASWILRRDGIAPSPDPGPKLNLQVD